MNNGLRHQKAFYRLLDKAPMALKMIILLLAAILCGYWWFTYTGLYKTLAEIQIKIFNGYVQILTGVLTIFITLFLVVFPLILFIGFLCRNRMVKEKENSKENLAEKIQRVHDTDQRKFVGMTFIIAGFVIFFSVGLYFFIKSTSYGKLTAININDIVHKDKTPSRYVRMNVRILKSLKMGLKSSRYGVTYYIPMQSRESGAELFPGVFLKISRYNYDRLKMQTEYQGTLERNALPGLIRTRLEERFPEIMKNHWVLDYRNSPKNTRTLGFVFLFLAGIFALIYLFIRIRRKFQFNQFRSL